MSASEQLVTGWKTLLGMGGVERSEPLSIKRRRGGQPGNQTARNNAGHPRPRRNFGNRGGKGAPKGNHFARKPRRLASAILFEDYRNNTEARTWIENHRALLDSLE